MSSDTTALLIALFLVHFLLDFPFQPQHWVADRYRHHAASLTLYLHTLAHGLGAGACFLLFEAPPVTALMAGGAVFVSHFFTDLGKSFLPRHSLPAFAADQILHWIVLLAVWGAYTGFDALAPITAPLISAPALLLALAYLVVLLPTSIVVHLCLRPWMAEIRQLEADGESLAKAGAVIGYLERLLILTFVLVGEYTAIGFVMALKTAFRFKDTEDRRKAEYMMMGTFLSFSLTIGIGLLVNYLLTII